MKDESLQKLRGGYYTPLEIANFITRWVNEIAPRSILEPSVGDGAFVSALANSKNEHIERIVGCEILLEEVTKARNRAKQLPSHIKTTIHNIDFTEWVLEQLSPTLMSSSHQRYTFDGIVGNPPFIRYQYMSDRVQENSEKIIKKYGLRFTKHTNIWVSFLIGCIALLRPGGRLGMIIPSEILHVLHAQSARDFLLEQCSRIQIIDPAEIWFENTLQGTVILFAEKKETQHFDKYASLSISRVSGKDFLHESPSDFFEKADFSTEVKKKQKWMLPLLSSSQREILFRVKEKNDIHTFSQLAEVSVGIVTGANKFFLISEGDKNKYQLTPYVHPMFGRSEHIPGIIFDEEIYIKNKAKNLPVNFVYFQEENREDLSKEALEYIEYGEGEKLHKRYKCKVREPWYKVPSVFSTKIAMLKRSHNYPRLILNTMEAYSTDTAYRIKMKKNISVTEIELVYSFVNSLTALSAELEGRHYGGGVLELVPSEIRKLIIPISSTSKGLLHDLNQRFINKESQLRIIENQTVTILKSIGCSDEEICSIIDSWNLLRERRTREGF